MKEMYSIVEGRDFALKGGRPGFTIKDGSGTRWVPIDTKTFDKAELDRLTADYTRRRGSAQIEKDIQAHREAKARQDSARRPQTPTPAPSPTPSAPTPTPSPAPSAPTPTPSPTPPTSKPTPTPSSTSSPATASTADKIKGGLEIYQKQIKSGDVKGAEATGKATWALANPTLASRQKTPNPLMKDMPGQNKAELDQLRGNAAIASISQSPNAKRILSGTARSPIANEIGKASLNRSAVAIEAPRPTTPTPTISNNPQMNRTADALTKNPLKVKKEAYDIVLDYLFSTGHADTIEEANYIMLEMDQNAIGIIMQEYNDYLLAEEVTEWVDGLLEEGYDLSDYTWDDIVEYYVSEANRQETEMKMNKTERIERRDAGWEDPKNRPVYNRVGHQRNRRNDPTPRVGDPSTLPGRIPGNRNYHKINQVFGTELPSGRIISGRTNQYVNPKLGGSFTLSNVGRGVERSPSGLRFRPGTGGNFGISGIGLAN